MNDNHLSNILVIKNYRKSFIESFDTNDIEIKNKLINATNDINLQSISCLLYTSPSPRDKRQSRMPSSA